MRTRVAHFVVGRHDDGNVLSGHGAARERERESRVTKREREREGEERQWVKWRGGLRLLACFVKAPPGYKPAKEGRQGQSAVSG